MAVFRLRPRGCAANAADVEAAPAADAPAAAAALGQEPQQAGGTGSLGLANSGGYKEVELQPHSSSVSPPTAVDPVADVAQTIVQGEEWGAAARAAEAAEGAARRMREAADKRAADAVAARRAGTMTRVEAAAEVEAALQTMVTPESAEDARMMQSPMDEEARELGFSLPLSFSEARSAAALLSTPKRTPGQKMVMVDQRTLGAASDL